jgi:hypothetical protein
MIFENCNEALADVIVAYLSYGVFDIQVSTFLGPRIETREVPSKIIESVATASKSAQGLALRFFANRQRVNFDVGKAFAEHTGVQCIDRQHEFNFVHYTRQWCLEHIFTVTSSSPGEHIVNLLPSLLDRNVDGTSSGPSPSAAYIMAVTKNNEALLACLLQSPAREFLSNLVPIQTHGGDYYGAPIDLAVCHRHKRMIAMLEEASGSTLAQESSSKTSNCPCYAVYAGHVSVLRDPLTHYELVSFFHICQ